MESTPRNARMRALRIAIGAVPLAAFALLVVLAPPLASDIRQWRGVGDGALVKVSSAAPVQQTFRPGAGKEIAAVSVVFATYDNTAVGPATVALARLEDEGKGPAGWTERVLWQDSVDLATVNDWEHRVFRLPEPIRTDGSVYAILVSVDEKVVLAGSAQDSYPQGALYFNGEPAAGDLVFRTYSPVDWLREPSAFAGGAFLGVPTVVLAVAAVLMMLAAGLLASLAVTGVLGRQ